jgi:threonine/homoserine/homoserine lactone efflux protein
MPAFWEGVLAGYGIAVPVGAIAVLIVDVGLRRGFRPAFAAGAGAASADFLYASLAALAGGALALLLAPFATPLRVASGLVLCGLGGYGLWRAWLGARAGEQSLRRAPGEHEKPEIGTAGVDGGARPGRVYAQFLGLTLLNPLTVAYFAALVLGRGAGGAAAPVDRLIFVAGAGLASLSWQTLLAGFGALAHRRLSPGWRTGLSIAGNLMVLGLGLRLLVLLALGR